MFGIGSVLKKWNHCIPTLNSFSWLQIVGQSQTAPKNSAWYTVARVMLLHFKNSDEFKQWPLRFARWPLWSAFSSLPRLHLEQLHSGKFRTLQRFSINGLLKMISCIDNFKGGLQTVALIYYVQHRAFFHCYAQLHRLDLSAFESQLWTSPC